MAGFVNKYSENGLTPLHIAVFNDRFRDVVSLLESGEDPRIRDTEYGKTPLYYAKNMKKTRKKWPDYFKAVNKHSPPSTRKQNIQITEPLEVAEQELNRQEQDRGKAELVLSQHKTLPHDMIMNISEFVSRRSALDPVTIPRIQQNRTSRKNTVGGKSRRNKKLSKRRTYRKN
jgi:hypothetical protein